LLQASLTVATMDDAAAAMMRLMSLVVTMDNWEPLKATPCVKVNLSAVGQYHVNLKLEFFESDKYHHHHCHEDSNIAVTVLQPHGSNVVS